MKLTAGPVPERNLQLCEQLRQLIEKTQRGWMIVTVLHSVCDVYHAVK